MEKLFQYTEVFTSQELITKKQINYYFSTQRVSDNDIIHLLGKLLLSR